MKITEEILDLVEKCVAPRGVHVIDLVIRGEGRGRSVELFIDAEQPVTPETCADVSREVARLIDGTQLVVGAYRLTVSSPGTSRPLKYLWQYRKHVGRRLALTVRGAEGNREVEGTLTSVQDDGVVLSSEEDGGALSVPFGTIVQGRVRTPW